MTTILIYPCGSGQKLQLRSEAPGLWISEVFNRNGTADCRVPNPPNAWQIVVNAPTGSSYNIFSLMGDVHLAEGDFMERARRDICTVVGHGQVSCERQPNTRPRLVIDTPTEGQTVAGELALAGWAVDLAALDSSGVDSVQVTASDTTNVERPVGSAAHGLARGDVAAFLQDSRFSSSGYSLSFDPAQLGLLPGPVTLRIRARSSVSGAVQELTRSFIYAPTSQPDSCSLAQYRASYYTNRDLAGAPAVVACEDAIDHDWGATGPGNGVGPSGFSVRWTRTISVEAGMYTLFSRFDDGYRVWIDDRPVIDRWFDQQPLERQDQITLAGGEQRLTVEYYNGALAAVAQLRLLRTPALTGIASDRAALNAGRVPVVIRGEYFAEPVSARLVESSDPSVAIDLESVAILDGEDTPADDMALSAVVPVSTTGVVAGRRYHLEVTSAGYKMELPLAFQVTPAVAEARVRAMFYMACDNDLESDCLGIFDSLEEALTKNPDLSIALFWDGAQEGDSAYYLLKADTDPGKPAAYTDGVDRFPYKRNNGEADSGDLRTLYEFSSWAQSHAPGRYKFLNLFGHGLGWAPSFAPSQPSPPGRVFKPGDPDDQQLGGMLVDRSSSSYLGTKDLTIGLKALRNAFGIDVVYLDACLMASSEVLGELAPYADYIIAHENLTYSDDEAYTEYFASITADTEPLDFVGHVVDISMDYWLEGGQPLQVGVTRGGDQAVLMRSIDALAGELIAALPTARQAIREAAAATARLDENGDRKLELTDDYLDLYDFADQLIRHPGISGPVKARAEAVRRQVGIATFINRHVNGPMEPEDGAVQQWNFERYGGQSIYFPVENSADNWRWQFYGEGALPTFAGQTRWDEFIKTWHTGQVPAAPPTDFCGDCLVFPARIQLMLKPPAYAKTGAEFMVPVVVSGVRTSDDLRGLQIDVQISDRTLLAIGSASRVESGPYLASAQARAVALPNNAGWSFITTVAPAPASAPRGEGVVVRLPFRALRDGCATLRFTAHKLRTGDIEPIRHDVAGGRLCVRAKGEIEGRLYLESRSAGDFGGVHVSLRMGQTTLRAVTDMYGYFKLPNIEAGSYTLSFQRGLFFQGQRQIRMESVETVSLTDMREVGLWAGDLNSNGRVTLTDYAICLAAAAPVADPAFDINADGLTDVDDCIIVRNNVGRRDMATTNPPPGTYGATVLRSLAESRQALPQPQGVPAQLSFEPGEDGSVRVSHGQLDGAAVVGMRMLLSTEASVGAVIPEGPFDGGFISAHQDGQHLFVVMSLAEGRTAPAAADLFTIQGGGDVLAAEVNLIASERETFLVHLPQVSR